MNHKDTCSRANSKPRHIMVLAGEPSGDVHASALVREIKKKDPKARISGMGGMNMEMAGTHLFYSIDKLSAMGLTEIVFQLKYIKLAFDEFKNQLRKNRPDLLILIDYPGFNLRAARFAKQKYSIKILYYITPKVWAWNTGRLKQIRAFVDHAALIFPFEEKLYKKAQIPATYVGNPLVDNLSEQNPASRIHDPAGTGLAKEGGIRTIGILPGSRKAEIDKLLKIMLRAGRLIHDRDKKTRFLVSCADSVSRDKIEALIAPFNSDGLFKLVPGHPKKIFDRADLLVAASGTVTLEAALYGVPTIIIYKMSFLSYKLARILVRVKYAGLANIITNREVMPELLQEEATPLKISSKALDMMGDLLGCSQKLSLVKKLLGSPGASERAARIALDLVK
ncbi:lipid-A-disaccharide synthase [Desulfospira joergensenii]|uniref:lipid-A-disaccharide synthase n=1 Tax=Desulfospira joergensenii TaxID=53329 RepID=UPI001FC9658C|nr:lipid-A-disaccharide synthase [Desulfospira joergensenii]